MNIIRIRTIFAPAPDLVRVRTTCPPSKSRATYLSFSELVFPLTHIGMAAVWIQHHKAHALDAHAPDMVLPFGDLIL